MYVYIYIYIYRRGGRLRGARFVSVTNGCEIVTEKRNYRAVS